METQYEQMTIPFPIEQESLFSMLSLEGGVFGRQRRERRPRIDWNAIYAAMEPLFPEMFA